jgi:hypothetical protein
VSEASTELVVRQNIKNMVMDLHERLGGLEESERKGADDFVLDIMEAILAADTVEEVFAAAEAGGVSGEDFVNRPFTLTSAGLQFPLSRAEYREAGGFPFFARMRVTEVATGEIGRAHV